jgi:hypothetical protein
VSDKQLVFAVDRIAARLWDIRALPPSFAVASISSMLSTTGVQLRISPG